MSKSLGNGVEPSEIIEGSDTPIGAAPQSQDLVPEASQASPEAASDTKSQKSTESSKPKSKSQLKREKKRKLQAEKKAKRAAELAKAGISTNQSGAKAPKGSKQGGAKGSPAYGVDVARMWVASSDWKSDVAISQDSVAQSFEQLRRLRNTARFILGALEGSTAAELGVANDAAGDLEAAALASWTQPPAPASGGPTGLSAYTPLDRVALASLRRMTHQARLAYGGLGTKGAVTALGEFAAQDMSAGYLDACKDRLYADPVEHPRSRSCRAVLWASLRGMVTSLAPVAPYTAEDIFQHSIEIVDAAAGGTVTDKGRDLLADPLVSGISSMDSSWSHADFPGWWEALMPHEVPALATALGVPNDGCMLLEDAHEAVRAVRGMVDSLRARARTDGLVGSDEEVDARIVVSGKDAPAVAAYLAWFAG